MREDPTGCGQQLTNARVIIRSVRLNTRPDNECIHRGTHVIHALVDDLSVVSEFIALTGTLLNYILDAVDASRKITSL